MAQALKIGHGQGGFSELVAGLGRDLAEPAAARGIEELADAVASATAGIAEHSVSSQTFLLARTIGTDRLRTLDALHLAAAVSAGAEQVVTYDERMSETARGVGLAVLAPI